MDEIKFRAWHNLLRRWDYFTLNDITTHINDFHYHLFSGNEFYLFTGLLDENGKEIYEGCIVIHSLLHKDELWEVFYCNDYCAFGLRPLSDINNKMYWTFFSNKIRWNECKIIGNKIENPELLNE